MSRSLLRQTHQFMGMVHINGTYHRRHFKLKLYYDNLKKLRVLKGLDK